jgi:hypothetical protein
VPLCPDPRHFLFVLPVGAMVWADGLDKIISFTKKDLLIVQLVLSLGWFLSWYFGYENHHYLYGPLMFGVFLWMKPAYRKVGHILVSIALLTVFIQNARYNAQINHAGQKELIQKVLSASDAPKWILTDGANTNIGSFYARYDSTKQFVVFHEYIDTLHPGRELYIIMNGMTAYLSNTNWDKVPEFVKTADTNLPVFFENSSGKVFKVR